MRQGTQAKFRLVGGFEKILLWENANETKKTIWFMSIG